MSSVESQSSLRRSDPTSGNNSGGNGNSSSNNASSPGEITAEQIAKVTKELDTVRSNMTVLSEILVEIKAPGGVGNHPEDLQLLRDLYKTCKEMQGRVSQLLCTPLTDELTIHMLQINDDLNDLFDRYDRKMGIQQQQQQQRMTDMPLIDLADEGTTPSLISDIQAMNLRGSNSNQVRNQRSTDDQDFDNLAQSRTTTDNSAGQGISSKPSEEQIMEGHRETDFEEMEAWLKANPGAASDASLMMSMPGNPQFDAYLAARSNNKSNSDKDPHQQPSS